MIEPSKNNDAQAARRQALVNRWGWLLLLLLAAVMLLPGTASLPLMDRDEPKFARAAVEMLQTGDWIVPYLNAEYRFDKPALTYWWMDLNYLIFGVTELAARLHGVLTAAAGALVIFAMGRRMFGPLAGLLAGVGWLTCFQVIAHGRLAVADMPMILCVVLAQWALWELLRHDPDTGADRPRRYNRWFWLLWIALGVGFLAKGPIAWAVPGLSLIFLRWVFWRRPLPWRHLQPLSGLPVTLVIAGIWGIPALIETQGLFWSQGMDRHVIERGTESFNGRIPIPGYYFVTALLSLFPWAAWLGQGWRGMRRDWNFQNALLVSWLAAPYLIFLFYATQLPHYTMPGFAAFFLLIFQRVDQRGLEIEPGWPRKVYCGIHIFWVPAFGGVAVLAAFWPFPPAAQPLRAALLALSGSLLFLQLGALLLRAPKPALRWSAMLGVAAGAFCLASTAHHIRMIFPPDDMPIATSGSDPNAPWAGEVPREKVNLVAHRYTEPSLIFYHEGLWHNSDRVEKSIRKFERKNARAMVVLLREWSASDALEAAREGRDWRAPAEDHRTEAEQLAKQLGLRMVYRTQGYNVARTSWAEVGLLVPERDG
jgi:hypothetical protein